MKMLYGMILLSAMTMSYASQSGGKLPEDFSFRKVTGEETQRVSIMKQLAAHAEQEEQKTQAKKATEEEIKTSRDTDVK
jgi:hypothetical protein